MGEDGWDGWAQLTARLGKKVQLVGDDLFVTNPRILKEGIKRGVGNAILVKVNQIGTLTETLEAIAMADAANYAAVISHRPGATEDPTIAAIDAATTATQITPAPKCRRNHAAQSNQVLPTQKHRGTHHHHPAPPP